MEMLRTKASTSGEVGRPDWSQRDKFRRWPTRCAPPKMRGSFTSRSHRTPALKKILAFVVALLVVPSVWSAEGMWTLDHPPLGQMKKELGWAPDQAWLDKAMRSAANLAGCSASFVSKNGLVLTNHHCVATCLDQLSTAQSNLLAIGFLADGQAGERKCPAMEVNRLEQISDVTADVTSATRGLEGTAYTAARNAVRAKLGAACTGDTGRMRCDVVELYHGGQYKLYRYHHFQDVRLAFAPERASAAFGGDPDNFNYPRYDLDMALVRVYEDGRPITVVDYLPFNTQGPAAGEPVFVTGNPGRTERELTVAQLATRRDLTLMDALLRAAELRGTLTEFRTTGAEPQRIGENDLNSLENYYKVLQGQLKALHDPAVFEKKQADEAAVRQYVAAHPALAKKAGGAWDAIAKAEKTRRDLHQPLSLIENGSGFTNRYFAFARTLVRGAGERPKPDGDRLPEFNDSAMRRVEARLFSPAPVYPQLEQLKLTLALTQMRERLGPDAPIVKRVLGRQSPSQVAAALVGGTRLGDPAVRKALWDGGADAIARSDDPMIRLVTAIEPDARALRARYEREVESVEQKNTELIAEARFAALGDTIYPDATGSLRLSYGVIAGWDEGGVAVPPFTTFGGAFARNTGTEPFALPASWLAARNRLDLTKPLDMVSTNDIIGGNSGSPMLNRDGELVGLMFDGNIHSLGGDFAYDPKLNRSVAVNSAGMLEALDKIYDAKALANELRGQ